METLSIDLGWLDLLVPLAVVPIVWLFRFVGCEPFEGTPSQRPGYRAYLLGQPGGEGEVPNPAARPDPGTIVAYWGLTDPPDTPTADDRHGPHDGSYRGRIASRLKSLLSSVAEDGRYFDDGAVEVPAAPGLFGERFTLEAWVLASWGDGDNREHTLFQAGGRYATAAGATRTWQGFRVWTKGRQLQVRVWPATASPFGSTLILLPQGVPAHVALVVAPNPTQAARSDVRLLVDGRVMGTGTVDRHVPPPGVPLLIGAGTSAEPTAPLKVATPFQGQIQEVVMHRTALSDELLANHAGINQPATAAKP